MNIRTIFLFAMLIGGLSACATSQQVSLVKQNIPRNMTTVAQVRQADNSADMDQNLQHAVLDAGLQLKPALPEGTVRSGGSDALISYRDVWRWDVVMYLQAVSINLFDARSGDLLVTGTWQNSALHGYPNAGKVVDDLVKTMAGKLHAAGQRPLIEG
jgi:hypothetical protein